MTTITAGVVTPVAAGFNTTPAYSGTFIPTLWSAKLNAKFYAASTFADVCNRDWEGDVSNLGDKVIINNIPDIAITTYAAGGNLSYQTPTPNTIELVVDQGKAFAFQVNDVLSYQAKPNLMNMFTDDAAQRLRVAVDSNCWYSVFDGANASNRGTTAGARSAAFNLGSDGAPIVINASNALTKLLEIASAMDEQNIPDTGRWVVIDPLYRTLLLQTDLGKAYLTGDNTSPVRNGLVGTIDRFKIYVSNLLPTRAASSTTWTSGDGTQTSKSAGSSYAGSKVRAILAGHTSAASFASQISKTETLRNPADFGDLVRGLQIYGTKVTKDTSLFLLQAASA